MSVRAAFGSWPRLNARVREGIAPLNDTQLACTLGQGRWPLWAVVGHLACQRVFWLCDFAGEAGVETTPFPNATWSCPGDEDLDNVLDADDLVGALDTTFVIVERALDTWTWDGLDEVIDHSDWDADWVHTRGFVLERVHAHDLWHAAEANEILTALGRPPIDPWG
ncbi:MAG: DinB family protein [Actinomycetota bacterium]